MSIVGRIDKVSVPILAVLQGFQLGLSLVFSSIRFFPASGGETNKIWRTVNSGGVT